MQVYKAPVFLYNLEGNVSYSCYIEVLSKVPLVIRLTLNVHSTATQLVFHSTRFIWNFGLVMARGWYTYVGNT